MSEIMEIKVETDLRSYLPGHFIVGPYKYSIEISNIKREEMHGECDFELRKIRIDENLDWDLTKPNWKYTVEVILHELLHAYNYNCQINDQTIKRFKNPEEQIVDQTARNFIQMLNENPCLTTLFSFFDS